MNPPGIRKYKKLPTGWEYRQDSGTNQGTFVNQLAKSMPLEHLRGRYQELRNERCSNESIMTQTPQCYGTTSGFGGSSHYIYPSNNMLAMSAFQHPSYVQTSSSHPLSLTSKSQMEMGSPLIKASQFVGQPLTPHRGQLMRRSTIQETSFSSQLNIDEIVQKIQNMFPTASENHIRLLLKKYYNREAVVISALQVEKYPVIMPGPYVTPPSERHLFHSQVPYPQSGNYQFFGNSITPQRFLQSSGVNIYPLSLNLTGGSHASSGPFTGYSRNTSPLPKICYNNESFANEIPYSQSISYGYHSSTQFGEHLYPVPARSHSSPKMKLKYMKIIFPQVEETLLLHLLSNADNNVQKASEELVLLGYTKRELSSPPPVVLDKQRTNGNSSDDNNLIGDHNNSSNSEKLTPALQLKNCTEMEKLKIKEQLGQDYPKISDHIITMALETVNYNEKRAKQILQFVHEEELGHGRNLAELSSENKTKDKTIIKEDCKELKVHVQENLLSSINNGKCGKSVSSSNNKNECESFYEKEIKANCQSASSLSSYLTTSFLTSSLLSSLSLSSSSTSTFITKNRSTLSKYGLSTYMGTSCRPNIGILRKNNHQNLFNNNLQQRSKLSLQKKILTTSTMDNLCHEFKSRLGRTLANGPNSQFCRGANEKLLLADYMTWNGANPHYLEGHQEGMASGSNPSLLSDNNIKKSSNYTPLGHNASICKGPQANLAKGSIYAKAPPSTNILNG